LISKYPYKWDPRPWLIVYGTTLDLLYLGLWTIKLTFGGRLGSEYPRLVIWMLHVHTWLPVKTLDMVGFPY
jgi:hypothetical protein